MRWRPFQLNRGLPNGEGRNKLGYYHERFGAQRSEAMIVSMKKVGKEVGISFSYGGSIGNSFNSHRLIWKAREDGGSELQGKVVDELFRAYFEEEKSLGVLSNLAECAERAGIDASELLADPSMGKEAVENELEYFTAKWKCRGVPLFIVDGKYPLSGAQPAEAFQQVFEMV